ncbi:RHS repeat-associated core domain-containing protein, partial [Pseudomonas fluorescens]|uniref:RHS repeat-associated core domain-containing protein n=1 Tax=Pseudomonas fluorescens TaxID=294 RepID=UPI0022B7E000
LTTPDGEIAWSAHYRAYGQIARLDVGKIDNPLRFQGQYYDQESGLHYNRHRYYHPDIGRYLTPDPVKLAGGINAYQYVPNPTGWVDPLGLSFNCPGLGTKSPTCSSPAEPDIPNISRRGAFREAKRDANIPMSQQPDKVADAKSGLEKQYGTVKMSDINQRSILDSLGKPTNTRVYQYTRADGSIVLIQDHSAGHVFGDTNKKGDQGAHFNLRPIATPRTGSVPGTKDHYPFRKKNEILE